jgi:hypothetical protein
VSDGTSKATPVFHPIVSRKGCSCICDVQEEERVVGRVQRSIYIAYLKNWSMFFFVVPASVLAMAISERGLQVRQMLKPVFLIIP